MADWVLYMLRCRDGTLYTGITTDIRRRVAAHNAGSGAKYTRPRRPVALAYLEGCESHSDALRREAANKRLPRAQKETLCRAWAAQQAEAICEERP